MSSKAKPIITCSTCPYETCDPRNAHKHKIKCEEKVRLFGGPIDRRNKYFNDATKLSFDEIGNYEKTAFYVEKLQKEGKRNNIPNNNISNVTVNQSNNVEINNNQLNQTNNQQNIYVMFGAANGEKKRVNDMDSPNLRYLQDVVPRWLDTLATALQEKQIEKVKSTSEDSSSEEEIVINGKTIKPKRQPRMTMIPAEKKNDNDVPGLTDFSKGMSDLIVQLYSSTYFNINHPENHSIRLKNRNRPNKSLEYVKDGKWEPIEKEDLYNACLEICQKNLQIILQSNPLYLLEDNVQEILDYEGEDEEEKAAMREYSLRGIEKNTVKNGSGTITGQIVDKRELRELKAYNRERFARKKRGEKCDNLDEEEKAELWAIVHKQLEAEDLQKDFSRFVIRQ